jgi:hypothetical protein
LIATFYGFLVIIGGGISDYRLASMVVLCCLCFGFWIVFPVRIHRIIGGALNYQDSVLIVIDFEF